ncbi:MAG TPA: hypothetical protein VK849_10370, partial [Longimicrobiales bacterium]|nr:hypothetical protein [Longimicrobiales bacterium]
YGPIEAVAYTSADLLGVSLDLLQTPLPVVVVVALHLFRTERLDAGTRLAVAWSLLPVATNALYWHHDLFMGPRLLYEAAPGWCLLLAASVLGLLRTLPERNVAQGMRRLCTRTGVAATLVLALGVGLVVAGPQKLKGYAALARTSGMAREAPETQGPSLVFVHEDWHSRLGARMSALGVRLDSIRVTLSQAPTCGVEAWVRAREAGARDAVPLAELVRLGRAAPGLREVVMPSGSRVRTYEGEVLSPECEREAASDFGGVLPLAPFLWQGDLPGLGAGGAMFVRDLGPERNVRLLELFPDRRPMLLAPSAPDGLRLVPYESGIAGMWAAP